MKIDIKNFRVQPDEEIRLKKWSTSVKPLYKSEKNYEELLAKHIKKMSARQSLLYADGHYALLLIFQAMDAAGKDGAIKHVMSGLNPQGCQVFSFKRPSDLELNHDFLWRTTCSLPERGRIGIFNRSYYEETLIVRVHPDILAAQKLPEVILQDDDFWEHRYDSINDLEKHLFRNGTHIVKFFLHVSKEEQRKRFLARIEHPEKNWKFSQADIEERKLWKEYRTAYEKCLSTTSSKYAPWYVIPADDKENAHLIISQVILRTLDELNLNTPKPDPVREKQLQSIRKTLEK